MTQPNAGRGPAPAGGPSPAMRAAVERQRAAQAAGAPPSAPTPPVADPLACPYPLPSGGLFNPGSDGMILIAPTRGEQEAVLSAAVDQPEAQLAALRHVTQQCFNTCGIPFGQLLVEDWTAAMINFLSISLGTDEVTINPYHEACGRTSTERIPLAKLPQIRLRRAHGGEAATEWPLSDVLDEDQIIAEIENGAMGAVRTLAVADSVQEPFKTPPLPITNDVITWRMLRMEDLARAEEFAARASDFAANAKGKPLNNYILARAIVAVNDRATTTLQAVQWVKANATATLNALRDHISSYGFGYDVTPWFRCKHCHGAFQARLPLDGRMFRRHARAKH